MQGNFKRPRVDNQPQQQQQQHYANYANPPNPNSNGSGAPQPHSGFEESALWSAPAGQLLKQSVQPPTNNSLLQQQQMQLIVDMARELLDRRNKEYEDFKQVILNELRAPQPPSDQ